MPSETIHGVAALSCPHVDVLGVKSREIRTRLLIKLLSVTLIQLIEDLLIRVHQMVPRRNYCLLGAFKAGRTQCCCCDIPTTVGTFLFECLVQVLVDIRSGELLQVNIETAVLAQDAIVSFAIDSIRAIVG